MSITTWKSASKKPSTNLIGMERHQLTPQIPNNNSIGIKKASRKRNQNICMQRQLQYKL